MNPFQNEQSNEENERQTKLSNNDITPASLNQLHPLQHEEEQPSWPSPHSNLPISWHNNDQTYHTRENSDTNQPQNNIKSSRPTPDDIKSSSVIDGTDHLPDYGWQRISSNPDQRLLQYRESASDQGHESDPSELLRTPVLFNGSPPTNSYLPTPHPSFGPQTHDIYPFRRPNRSMSLSMGTNVWTDESRSPPALPAPSGDHHEVVPYSQEWRVILRSQPQGRTVLYNPQMQSLVVQSTVGLDSHPMSLHDDSRICRLCRRPLDLDESTVEQDMPNDTSAFMDSNYFRMLADANMALSGRGSLQDGPKPQIQTQSSLGSPTSSSRASLDLDNQVPLHDSPRDHPTSSHLSHDALNQGYYERFFVEQKKLGRGFRGSVFLCQHVLDGIHLGEYAIKKVAVGDNHEWLVQMLREVHLLERLHHPNIVSYKHAWLENHQLHKFGPEVTCLFILMECANGGNLEEFVEQPPEITLAVEPESFVAEGTAESPGKETETAKPLSARERLQTKRQRLQESMSSSTGKSGESEQSSAQPRRHLSITEIWSFFFDICEGLAHLHQLGIIHRDLKPPNLLLSYSNSRTKGTNGERPRILITDFGECEILDQTAKRDRTGATGTLEFLAPELLAVDAEGRYTNEFSFKGDMWSLGMILYYLCYSRLPYSQIEDVDILRTEIRQFKTITIPEDEPGDRVIPEELKFLIRVLLSPEQSKRPSCDDILKTLSHQRERMMRGDMGSDTTSMRTSPNLGYGGTESTLKAKEIGPDDNELTSKKQVTSRRGSNDLQTYRQNYYPVRQNSGKVPVRRKSRATLIMEPSSKANVILGSSSLSSPGGRHTAIPSINLHKRVKPLGLGLRHMLRRKLNHPASYIGAGTQRNSSWNSENGNYSSTLGMTVPVPTFPLALEDSTIVPNVRRASPTQISTAIAQHQGFQHRKQATHGRESSLGSTMELAPEFKAESSKSNMADGINPLSSGKRDIATEDQISNSPQQKKTRHYEQGQSFATAPLRETVGFDSSGESSSVDDRRVNQKMNRGIKDKSVNDKETKGKTVAQTGPVLGKSYWTSLASSHARDKSNSNIATATDASSGNFIADESSEGDQFSNTMPSGVGSGRRRSQVRSRASLDKIRPDYSQGIRSTASRQGSRRNSRQLSIDQKNFQQVQQHQHHHHHRHQAQEKAQHFHAEDFSILYMFVSLVIRVWFCHSICNPVMVRPIVLYPVLILTVVWDRYLISLISEKIKDSFIRSGKHRRGSASKTGAGFGGSEGTGITGMSSTSTREVKHEHGSLRKRSSTQSFTRAVGKDSGGVHHHDNTGTDADVEFDPFSGGEGSMMVEQRNHDGDQINRNSVPIWQAFISGVVLQLLWIGAIWGLSRDGLCIM
ncbi:putative serine/threonine-protein kinase iks1 [Entomortierella lignicola]|nr:putative serine/threonine-protein kinase iks1 [Entomortierella lignicola]